MSLVALQNFYKVSLTRRMATTGALNMYVSALPTTITEGWVVISPSNTSLREIVKFSSVGTDSLGVYLVIAAAGDRGLGGTNAQTHEIAEPVRMNYTSLHQQEISDAMDQIVAAGAQTATTSISGIAKLPRISQTTGTTHSLTTIAGERVMVWAKGNFNQTSAGATSVTVTLKYGGVTKDTIVPYNENTTRNCTFALMYTEIPGAATADITVELSGGNGALANVVIMVQII